MKGSLVPLGPGHWRLRVYTGTRTAGGNPRQASRQFRGTKAQAQTALANFVTEVTSDRDWHEQNATVADLTERWMQHLANRGATGYTLTDYRRKLNNHILPAFGSVRITRLSAAQLDRTYDAWTQAGLAPATVRKLHSMIGAAFHQAVKWGWLKQSPTDRATPPKLVSTDTPTLTDEQVRDLHTQAVEQANDPGGVLPTAILLGAITGARRGELCALRWSDVDWLNASVRIHRSLTVLAKGKWTEGGTKTKRGRLVTLDDRAMAELYRRRRYQEQRARLLGQELTADPFILSRSVTGTDPLLPNGLTHDFRDLADKLGLPYHFHSLRHYAATAGLASGSDPVTVAKRLGHADPKLTMGTYGHEVQTQARELASKMSDALLGQALALPAGD